MLDSPLQVGLLLQFTKAKASKDSLHKGADGLAPSRHNSAPLHVQWPGGVRPFVYSPSPNRASFPTMAAGVSTTTLAQQAFRVRLASPSEVPRLRTCNGKFLSNSRHRVLTQKRTFTLYHEQSCFSAEIFDLQTSTLQP